MFTQREVEARSVGSVDPRSNLSANTRASAAHNPSSPSASGKWKDFFVLCLYDFNSTDPHHQQFQKNDILEIVRVEDSGWWAALVDDKIGWIPESFVQPISDPLAKRLKTLKPDERPAYLTVTNSPGTPTDIWADLDIAGIASPDALATFPSDATPYTALTIPISPLPIAADVLDDYFESSPRPSPDANSIFSRSQDEHSVNRDYLYSPTAPIPLPRSPSDLPPVAPRVTPSVLFNKPTPPTPVSSAASPVADLPPTRSQSMRRIYEDPSTNPGLTHRSNSASALGRRTPVHVNDSRDSNRQLESTSAKGLANGTISQTRAGGLPKRRTSSLSSGSIANATLPRRPSAKVMQITGDEDAHAFHNAKTAQEASPWYLKPTYGSQEIKLEYDGSVKAGTLPALVERLTVDPLKLNQETMYRKAFLTTFQTFASADEVFDLLTSRYTMEPPTGLSDAQLLEWKEKKLRSTQTRVLSVLTTWMDDHGMLTNAPHLVPRLEKFLLTVQSPQHLALTARLMLQSLEKLQFQSPLPGLSPNTKRKTKPKPFKNDLLKIDPNDLGTQITLMEFKAYAKIRPAECLNWGKIKGQEVANLTAFCSTSDKLADWVKLTILSNEGLGKRADTIDFWIRVAEKCRALNNISSLFSLVAGLSSIDIGRLHLTWAHVGRGQQLETLAKLCDSINNFSAYRTLFQATDGPSVPFIGMLLTDLVHIQDQQKDNIVTDGQPLINFIKRQKLSDITYSILKFRSKPYVGIEENLQLLMFIDNQIQVAAGKDQGTFWARSQELQAAEVAHADIRKGLEAAGF